MSAEQFANWNSSLSGIRSEMQMLSRNTEKELDLLKDQMEAVSRFNKENLNQTGSVLEMLESGKGLNLSAFEELFDKVSASVNDTFSNMDDSLEALAGRIGDILNLKTTLEEVSYSIRNVSLLMKIKSSKLVKSEFDHVVVGLEGLAQQIKENTEGIHLSAIEAVESIDSLKDSLKQRLGTFNHQISRNQRQVRKLLDLLNRVILDAKERCQRVERLCSQGDPQIGSVLSSLQIYDVVRQQTDHVIGAIDDITERLAKPRQSESERGELMVWMTGVIKLQKDQIDNVISSTRDTAAGLGNTLNRVAELGTEQGLEAKAMANQMTSVNEKMKTVDQDFNAISNTLTFSQDKTEELVESIANINENILKVSRQVSQIEISRNDLEALTYNAVFKAAKVGGKGRVMAAITDEITGLSREVQAKITDKDSVIKSIVSSSREFKSTLTEKLNSQLEISQETSGEIQENSNRIHQDCQTVTEVFDTTQKLIEEIGHAQKQVRFDKVICETLGRVSIQLQSILDEINLELTDEQKSAALSDDHLDDLARQYPSQLDALNDVGSNSVIG